MSQAIDPNLAMAGDFVRRSTDFLNYVFRWAAALPMVSISDLVGDYPAQAAICAVDLVEGFCHQGPLASDRVAGTLPAVADLFTLAHNAGIDQFLLVQDAHHPNAREFQVFPAHCIYDTPESQTIAALAELPFAPGYAVLPKNSISSGIGTGLEEWLVTHPLVRQFICVGDVTDMCLYQLAMHLNLSANAHDLDWEVVVPADCVQTYHLSVNDARRLSALPHEGDLFHLIFLYHMALNGVRVVGHIDR